MTRGRFSKHRNPPEIKTSKKGDTNRKSQHKMKSLDGTQLHDPKTGKALNIVRFYGCRNRKGYGDQ
jgi:hypothetical protein